MGEHTREVVGALPGMDDDTVDKLLASGVLYESAAATQPRD
jgi:hypothetical protein